MGFFNFHTKTAYFVKKVLKHSNSTVKHYKIEYYSVSYPTTTLPPPLTFE